MGSDETGSASVQECVQRFVFQTQLRPAFQPGSPMQVSGEISKSVAVISVWLEFVTFNAAEIFR